MNVIKDISASTHDSAGSSSIFSFENWVAFQIKTVHLANT